MIERDSTDFPQPDSPTTPSVLPRSRLNETPSTARTRAAVGLEVRVQVVDLEQRTVERRVGEALAALALASASQHAPAHVEAGPHDVTEVVERQHRQEDERRRREDHVRRSCSRLP